MDGKRVNWTYTSRLLGLMGVTLFLATAFTPLPNLLSSRLAATPSQLEPADAIVVLGSSISADGVLSANSMRQAFYGISLYRKGLAPLLVFSGPARRGAAEADVRAELARELGIPSHAILTEARARTTREEALREKVLLQPRGARRILLVTGSLHMRRALHLFERVGFEVYAAPVDETSKATDAPEARLWLMRRVVEEFFARGYYQAAGLFKAVEDRW